jgi:hypothetical protein
MMPNLKKLFLNLLIASVAVSALIGIAVILFGNFGETESKILTTASIITCTSILGLACGAYLETRRGKILPLTGIGLAVLSAIVWIIMVWAKTSGEKLIAKTVASTTLLAFSCSLVCLLSIARLDKRFIWSNYLAHFSIWSLTAIFLYLLWAEIDPGEGWLTRIIGVLSILIAALTIFTPIFHKLSQQQPPTTEEIDAEIARLQTRIEELEKQRKEVSSE